MLCLLAIVFAVATSACNGSEQSSADGKTAASPAPAAKPMTGKMGFAPDQGTIGSKVSVTAEGLKPNEPLQVVWADMVGGYSMEKNYSYLGTEYKPIEKEIASGNADGQGKWVGEFVVPEGFGDDHDVFITQNNEKVAQANYFVETVFRISPASGPIGTEIMIHGEGLSWKMYGSLWHLNYDNAYTGMITAVSTNGTATGKIRATGSVGNHVLTIESGSSGFPYMNRAQSAINYINTQRFDFRVTDGKPAGELAYIETPPPAANGGIKLPDPVNKNGVSIAMNKPEGFVGDLVTISGSGLPKNEKLSMIWHTMVGTRVSAAGYGEKSWSIGELTTDSEGRFSHDFNVPDDLGGLPHLIEVKSGDEVYGQTYLKINPKIVSVTPASGPPGTPFTVLIKGSGWTEFDNTYNVTYDNSNIGYICGFNSQGTIQLPLVASGEAGYHLIDIYPGIYKGQQIQPNLYLRPQLTYLDDHPGTSMPALRTYFEVTK